MSARSSPSRTTLLCATATGSWSTYITRASGSAARATSCTFPNVGMPEPMSRNWVTPSDTAYRTARRMNARFACMTLGSPGMNSMALRAASRSTSKLCEPPR